MGQTLRTEHPIEHTYHKGIRRRGALLSPKSSVFRRLSPFMFRQTRWNDRVHNGYVFSFNDMVFKRHVIQRDPFTNIDAFLNRLARHFLTRSINRSKTNANDIREGRRRHLLLHTIWFFNVLRESGTQFKVLSKRL